MLYKWRLGGFPKRHSGYGQSCSHSQKENGSKMLGHGSRRALEPSQLGVVDRIVWAAAWPLDPTWLPTDHSGLQEAGEGLLLVDARLAGWEG